LRPTPRPPRFPYTTLFRSLESKGIFHYIMEKDELAFYAIPLVKDGMKMITLCPDNSNGVWVFPYSSPFMHINKKTKEITHFNLRSEEHTSELQSRENLVCR